MWLELQFSSNFGGHISNQISSGSFKHATYAKSSKPLEFVSLPQLQLQLLSLPKSIANWIYQDIICHWGALWEIVTNNGSPFLAALAYLKLHYQFWHICISSYNSRANGIVERAHLDVRQALFKAADGVENKWLQVTYAVFWAEQVTVRCHMGCSPYYVMTGTHPLIPLNITEATYLLPPPDSILSTTDLIAHCVITLQKHDSDLAHLHSIIYQARVKAVITFEKKHFHTICDFDFKRNDLVLMWNTKIEYALNKKMKPLYDGPFIVISRNHGGAYILCQLDGSIFHRLIAAFHLLPYHAHNLIYLPDDMMDIDTQKLWELEQLNIEDDINLVTIEVATDYVDDEEEESENEEHWALSLNFVFLVLFYILWCNSFFMQLIRFCNI